MFKKILIAAGTAIGVVAAALTFQSPANAGNVQFGIHIGSDFHDAKHRDFGHHGVVKHKKKYFKRGHGIHKPAHRYHRQVLTNREIRHHLRHKGLYNIRFLNRHHGVAKVIADNRKGYVAKYKVNARNGRIIGVRVLRHHNAYRGFRGNRGFHGHRGHRNRVSFFAN